MSGTLLIPQDVQIEAEAGELRVVIPAYLAGGDLGTQPTGKKAGPDSRAKVAAEGGDPASAPKPPVYTVALQAAELAGGAASRELVRRLASRPLALAGLLEDGAEALGALLPEQPPWRRLDGGALAGAPAPASPGEAGAAASGSAPAAAAACSCGAPGCAHAELALAYADAAWAAAPGLRLALLGWTPEALAAAVLDRWAALQPLPDPEEALRQAAGGPEGTPRQAAGEGPSIAEWLAEMARQGRLHLPGPQFHDVEADLRDLRLPSVEPGREPGPDPAPWAALLSGVSGAPRGLSLVAGRVMERAAELAASLNTKPR